MRQCQKVGIADLITVDKQVEIDNPRSIFKGPYPAERRLDPEKRAEQCGRRKLGFYLGRLIYMMDAFIDLRSDLKHGRYNPLSFVTALDAGFLDVLAGEAAQVYESLPLLRDKPMLDAIIYQGVWNRYNYERRRREKKEGRSSAHT